MRISRITAAEVLDSAATQRRLRSFSKMELGFCGRAYARFHRKKSDGTEDGDQAGMVEKVLRAVANVNGSLPAIETVTEQRRIDQRMIGRLI